MKKKLICIECPKGCELTVDIENNKVLKVSGGKCPKGDKYAVSEIENPERVLTSSVLTEGLSLRMIPVKTDKPVPKAKLLDAMAEIKKIRLKKHVNTGDIITENLLGPGINLVATRQSAYDIIHGSMIFIFILTACLFAPPVFCEDVPPTRTVPLTLKKAIDIAFIANRELQMQEMEVEAAKADILGAESEFLPKLNIGGGYTYNEAALGGSLSGIKAGKKDIGTLAGYQNDNLLNVSLSESVYKGGGRIAGYRRAELNYKVQKETLRARKLDIEFETKRLYHGLQLAYETARIMGNLVSQAEEHYEDVKKRYQQGVSSKFDMLQSRVHLAKTIPPYVRAKNAIELIMAELKKLLTMDINDPAEIEKPLKYSLININEGQFLDEAYVNKPELVLKDLGIDIQKWSIKLAQSENLPTIDAQAGYNYRTNNLSTLFNYKHTNWAAGITFNVPIYDGFSAKAKVERARAIYAKSVVAKEDVVAQTAVDIRKACLDLTEAQEIIISQEASLVEAREALRLSIARYDSGVGTNLDVLDAQVSLSQVERNLAEGIYDYLMAKAYLDKTVGLETFRGD